MPPLISNGINSHIVPMPLWSTYTGCTKLGLSILILAFSSVCIQIWGLHTAFVVVLATSVTALLMFVYYVTALTHSPRIYHSTAILALESLGAFLWMTSMIVLATWTHTSLTSDWLPDTAMTNRETYHWSLPKGLTPAKIATDHFKKYATGKYVAATRLAGVSAGLAGLQGILYSVTMVVFAYNLRKQRTERQLGEDGNKNTSVEQRNKQIEESIAFANADTTATAAVKLGADGLIGHDHGDHWESMSYTSQS